MFRKVTDELRGICVALNGITEGLRSLSDSAQGPDQYEGLRDRLDKLEGPLQARLGEVEGLIAKADGLKNAARAAEERARGSLARQERLADELEAGDDDEPAHISDEDIAHIQEGDALRGHENRVHGVRSTVESLAAFKFEGRR